MIIVLGKSLANIAEGDSVPEDVVDSLDVERLLDFCVWSNGEMQKHDNWNER